MAWNGERGEREREHHFPPLRPANPMAEIGYLFFFFFGRRVCIFLLLFFLRRRRESEIYGERESVFANSVIIYGWGYHAAMGKERRATSDIEYSSKKMWERKSLFFKGGRKTISLFCNNGGREALPFPSFILSMPSLLPLSLFSVIIIISDWPRIQVEGCCLREKREWNSSNHENCSLKTMLRFECLTLFSRDCIFFRILAAKICVVGAFQTFFLFFSPLFLGDCCGLRPSIPLPPLLLLRAEIKR